MWEEIKMIKAFVFAEEKGYDRGKKEGQIIRKLFVLNYYLNIDFFIYRSY